MQAPHITQRVILLITVTTASCRAKVVTVAIVRSVNLSPHPEPKNASQGEKNVAERRKRERLIPFSPNWPSSIGDTTKKIKVRQRTQSKWLAQGCLRLH